LHRGQHQSPEDCAEAKLGHGFGKRITIEALVVVRNNPAMRRVPEICLHVQRIEGVPAPADLILSFTRADLVPDDISPGDKQHYGDNLPLVPGRLYRLRGYETGEWIGVPAELMGCDPNLDPPHARPFQFHIWFYTEVGAGIDALGQQVSDDRLERVRFW
jgi:hypothetical protein